MMMNSFFLKIFLATLIFTGIIAPTADAITGEHLGEQKYLTYRIEYLSPEGVTVVGESGIDFISECCAAHEDIFLPEQYFGEYPLYFTGQTFRVGGEIVPTNPTNLLLGHHARKEEIISPRFRYSGL